MDTTYGIIGFPLKHTFSPIIHERAIRYYGLKARYKQFEIHPENFDREIRKLKQEQIKGFNVTIPYKQQITARLDWIDPTARAIGAVNTVLKQDDRWFGYNTDYPGFLAPLRDCDCRPETVVMVGAGGAARAVAFGLIESYDLEKFIIVNRTVDRARMLADDLEQHNKKVHLVVHDLENINGINESVDLIINTTSVGMDGNQNALPLDPLLWRHPQTIVYDLIYNPSKTPLLERAEKEGLVIINGLPMLIEQAAESFRIWTDKSWPEELKKEIEMLLKAGNKKE